MIVDLLSISQVLLEARPMQIFSVFWFAVCDTELKTEEEAMQLHLIGCGKKYKVREIFDSGNAYKEGYSMNWKGGKKNLRQKAKNRHNVKIKW